MKRTAAFFALTMTLFGQSAGSRTFYESIRRNDLPAIRQLIQGSGAKAPDAHGNTPLLLAAALGSVESMGLLLDAGADPNAANDSGATPLMWCAGDAGKVRLLLSKGAKVNVRSKLGRTPLLVNAAYDGAIEAARLLIEQGADIDAHDESGVSVLEQAANSNNLELARLLLTKGAKVETADSVGFTPLISASGNGDRNGAMVRLLLEHGAKANVVSADTVEKVKNGPLALGRLTPLQQAAQMSNYEAVDALLKAGADVNAKDVRGSTALVFAVATDRVDPKVVELLLAKGADRQPAALDWVRRNQNSAILPLFGLKPSPAAGTSIPSGSRRNAAEAMTKAIASSQPIAAKFFTNGGCLSCHSQFMNGMAVSAAKAAGVKADDAMEAAATRTTINLLGDLQEQLFQAQDPSAGVEGMEFSLMQLAAAGAPANLTTDSLVHYLAATQRKEGDWPFFEGRPPIEGSSVSQTARAIRVLRAYTIPARKTEFNERVERAAAWLETATLRTTTDRATQILGLRWAGRTVAANRVAELASKQRADGGWGQTDNLATDAYATGEALWALHESGMAPSDPAYRRGIDYLLRTQQEDGTWHVATRAFGFQPYFQSGFPYDHDQWISQAGTAMATIALSFAAK